ncbi:MAG: hypothetical protein MHM6MM_006444 [Cercozoa sp. M6MM]
MRMPITINGAVMQRNSTLFNTKYNFWSARSVPRYRLSGSLPQFTSFRHRFISIQQARLGAHQRLAELSQSVCVVVAHTDLLVTSLKTAPGLR